MNTKPNLVWLVALLAVSCLFSALAGVLWGTTEMFNSGTVMIGICTIVTFLALRHDPRISICPGLIALGAYLLGLRDSPLDRLLGQPLLMVMGVCLILLGTFGHVACFLRYVAPPSKLTTSS